MTALGGLFGACMAVAAPDAPSEWCGALGPKQAKTGRTMKGLASWYGPRFEGRRTASGERFDSRAFTAAHRTWPFGTRVRVTDVRTGRSVVVRINDRLGHRGRVIDLSRAAAARLGLVRRGLGRVLLEELKQ